MQPNVVEHFVTKEICDLINPYLEGNSGEHPIDIPHPQGKTHTIVYSNGEIKFFEWDPQTLGDQRLLVFNIINLIHQAIAPYFGFPKDKLQLKGLEYTLQQAGQGLSLHTDTGVSKNGVHSAILYLTDDYEEGEIVFYDTHLQQDPIPTKYKPKAGTLIHFPGTEDYPHEVLPVKSGKRGALVLFFENVMPTA